MKLYLSFLELVRQMKLPSVETNLRGGKFSRCGFFSLGLRRSYFPLHDLSLISLTHWHIDSAIRKIKFHHSSNNYQNYYCPILLHFKKICGTLKALTSHQVVAVIHSRSADNQDWLVTDGQNKEPKAKVLIKPIKFTQLNQQINKQQTSKIQSSKLARS